MVKCVHTRLSDNPNLFAPQQYVKLSTSQESDPTSPVRDPGPESSHRPGSEQEKEIRYSMDLIATSPELNDLLLLSSVFNSLCFQTYLLPYYNRKQQS